MTLPSPARRKKSRKVLLWSGLGVGLLAAAVVVALVMRNAKSAGAAKKKSDKQEAPAAPVELSAVKRGSISTFLESTTFLEARNMAVLVAKQQGQVVQVLVEEGDQVKKGDVLARLDETEARLAYERAELASEMADRESERGKQMHERKLLSEKDIDDVRLRQRTAHQEMEQKRYELSQMKVTAPFAGYVVGRMVNLGETVTPGKECFRLADMDPLLARVYFPERELPHVRVGQEATLAFDTHPDRAYTARVTLVNPVVDPANGTFKVTLELLDPDPSLRPGAFARARLLVDRHEDALVLPRRAVLSEDGEDYVFVARADSVLRIPVAVGAIEHDLAQILEGVKEGDKVVTVGQGGLKQGTKIKAVTF